MTHSIVDTATPKSRLTTGNTILTTLVPIADMNAPTPTAIRIHHLRSNSTPHLELPVSIFATNVESVTPLIARSGVTATIP